MNSLHAAAITDTRLGELRQRRQELQAAKDAQSDIQRGASRAITQLDKDLDAVNAEIKSFQRTHLKVSDHALVQYIARVYHLDTETLREQLLPTDPRTLSAIATLGSGTYPTDTHRIVLKGDTVVTVLPLDK